MQTDRRRQQAKLSTKEEKTQQQQQLSFTVTNTITTFQITIFNKCRNAIVEYMQLVALASPMQAKTIKTLTKSARDYISCVFQLCKSNFFSLKFVCKIFKDT